MKSLMVELRTVAMVAAIIVALTVGKLALFGVAVGVFEMVQIVTGHTGHVVGGDYDDE